MTESPRSSQRRRVSERTTQELERLWRPVSMAVRRLLPASDPDHDELVRTALACVVAALAVRPPHARFSESWLVAVARDVTFEHLQRRKQLGLIALGPSEPANDDEPAQESPAHMRERVRRVALGLGRVGQNSAVMVIQHDVLGQELEQIAESMGISVTRARWRLVRGRRALLEQLRKSEATPSRNHGG